MSKEKEVHYIRLLGFSEKANMIVNAAIKLSESYKCENVNTVHLFICLLKTTDVGKQLMEELHITYEDVMDEFEFMACKRKDFGFLDSSEIEFTPDYFSHHMHMMFTTATKEAAERGDCVSTNDLLSIIVETAASNKEMIKLLDNLIISPKELIRAYKSINFIIPNQIAAFVDDITHSNKIMKMKIDGVEKYVDECIEVLCRKNKANPCLIGKAGVGKTSIVHRLVQRIHYGQVPEQLAQMHVCFINSATLTSGTKYRGDFEARMKILLDWASDPNTNVILFIDELHSFVSSGKTSEDTACTAGNMIKPYISTGDIRIIGATTLTEYHKFIESDPAFERRLQSVEVKEPSVEDCIIMVKNTISEYEQYHSVSVSEKIIEKAVKLSDTYMRDKSLPDKAYTIIDQACTKAKLASRRKVTEQMILDVISKNTGVDIRELSKKDVGKLSSLDVRLKERVIGQDHAVDIITKAIKRSKSGVMSKDRPIASFLFVGPTGVGKTEICKALRDTLGLAKDAFIRIDMSEFSEKHSVSKLIGTAPGYVGYGEGGQLTEKVKHNPCSIILFDEIEKAHPEIFNAFLQLLDDGRLTDGNGDTIDFTNCIIAMTSNAGYSLSATNIKHIGFGQTEKSNNKSNNEEVNKALEKTFRPEFINRIDSIVVFNQLGTDSCVEIAKLRLKKISNNIMENKGIRISFDNSVYNAIVEHGYSDKYGARNINREAQKIVEDSLSDMIINGDITTGDKIVIDYDAETDKIRIKSKKTGG